MMPTRALFLAFSFLPRIVEGAGTALFSTASYAQLTEFYPDKKGTIVVSDTTVPDTHSPVNCSVPFSLICSKSLGFFLQMLSCMSNLSIGYDGKIGTHKLVKSSLGGNL